MSRMNKFNNMFEFVGLDETDGKLVIEIITENDVLSKVFFSISDGDGRSNCSIKYNGSGVNGAISFINEFLYGPLLNSGSDYIISSLKDPRIISSAITIRSDMTLTLYTIGGEVTLWASIGSSECKYKTNYKIDFEYKSYMKNMSMILDYLKSTIDKLPELSITSAEIIDKKVPKVYVPYNQ